ncbi:MAG TPA: DUF362 domain-containing protein [Terriglobia bacterium]|nr:DUF362 domain-containing protein [Terriglobia bacterium]
MTEAGEKSLVVLRGVKDGPLGEAVRQCMELCNWTEWVKPDARVVVKPNLCTAIPGEIESANTDRAVTEAVCEVLLSRTKRISIVEADHDRQTAWDAFRESGYVEMAKRLGVDLVNLSEVPAVRTPCPPLEGLNLPRMLLEADAFITIPVLKTHALTYYTGVLKNQWGCVPSYRERMIHHRLIHELLGSIHRVLKPAFALIDGIVAMEGRGPSHGRARRLDIILASRDGVALDASAMRLVGLDPSRCKHVVLAARHGLGRMDPAGIEVDGDWEKYRVQFEPAPKDWLNWAAYHMCQFPWFVKYVMENNAIYYPVRGLVQLLRKIGVVGG